MEAGDLFARGFLTTIPKPHGALPWRGLTSRSTLLQSLVPVSTRHSSGLGNTALRTALCRSLPKNWLCRYIINILLMSNAVGHI
jgi:hypothetical protein